MAQFGNRATSHTAKYVYTNLSWDLGQISSSRGDVCFFSMFKTGLTVYVLKLEK